jgi:DNA-binding PucR family transcriptional regulator
MTWQHPSERTCDLLRQGAEIALNSLQEWLDEIDEATLAAVTMRAIAQDPALRAATRRINRAHLAFWASETARDPGAPVPAYIGPDSLGHARDLVRRGLDESALDSYRVGQNAAWRRWMQTAFTLTSDPDELRELLDVSARSVSGFLDATIVDIAARMAAEREELRAAASTPGTTRPAGGSTSPATPTTYSGRSTRQVSGCPKRWPR